MTAWLTVREAAGRVSFKEDALRRAIQRGELVAVKRCGRIRIEEAALERWMRTAPPAAPVPEPAVRRVSAVRRSRREQVDAGSFRALARGRGASEGS